MIIILWKTENY